MRFIFILFITLNFPLFAQLQDSLRGKDLLEKCIFFHDPLQKWNQFQGKIFLSHGTDEITKSEVTIDFDKNYFCYQALKEGELVQQIVDDKDAYFKVNKKKNKAKQSLIDKYYLGAAQSKFWKNFFVYLYGLPMKLTDDGTIVHDKVYKEQFNGKEYLVLKVGYSPEVGKEIWYFYIHPQTFELKAYQFYHNEEQNDGEYILLEELVEFEGMKIPKTRIWFMNKDDKQIGRDVLDKIEKI